MSAAGIDVSVVMPAFNAATTIDDALRSALSQHGAEVEVLVVDDGSSDDTVARARAHGPRVRVLTQANAGPQAARNRGLAEARGTYIAFLDSDDIWLPGKLAAQLAVLRADPGVAAVFTRWHVWEAGADGRYTPPQPLASTPVDGAVDENASGWLYTRLLFDCEMLTTTVMVRRDTLQRTGFFDPSLRVGEDYDLWLRLAREGRIVKLASVGALYRISSTSASRWPHDTNYELEVVRRALERWGAQGPDGQRADETRLTARLEQLAFDHANLHLMRGDPRIAAQHYKALLRQHPGRPRLWFNLLRALCKPAPPARPAAAPSR